MTLGTLHRVIQVCMGWDNSDTHQFLVGKIFYQSGFGIRDTKRDVAYDEHNFELHQLEEGMQFLFTYLYDGGEGWELEIALEEVIRNGSGRRHPRPAWWCAGMPAGGGGRYSSLSVTAG